MRVSADSTSMLMIKNLDTGEAFNISDEAKLEALINNLTPATSGSQNDTDIDSEKVMKTSAGVLPTKQRSIVGKLIKMAKSKTSSGRLSAIQGKPDCNQVKVMVHAKRNIELGNLKRTSASLPHRGAVWCIKFSPDGKHMASGGEDGCVIIYKWEGKKLVILRKHTAHKSDVVALAWSKSMFLLSASTDKTVRLWHVSKEKCLWIFQHSDFVTSIDFHPLEDGIFASGSFDKKVRLWNITEGRVAQWRKTPEMVTAICFNRTGDMIIAGLYSGQCIFYRTEGGDMKYFTQIDCRNRRGAKRNGRKVTGLVYMSPEDSPTSHDHLVVTTNDSRTRLYNLDDFTCVYKCKGGVNNNMQISASPSECGRHLVCGSEDNCVYVWRIAKKSHSIPAGAKRFNRMSIFKLTTLLYALLHLPLVSGQQIV